MSGWWFGGLGEGADAVHEGQRRGEVGEGEGAADLVAAALPARQCGEPAFDLTFIETWHQGIPQGSGARTGGSGRRRRLRARAAATAAAALAAPRPSSADGFAGAAASRLGARFRLRRPAARGRASALPARGPRGRRGSRASAPPLRSSCGREHAPRGGRRVQLAQPALREQHQAQPLEIAAREGQRQRRPASPGVEPGPPRRPRPSASISAATSSRAGSASRGVARLPVRLLRAAGATAATRRSGHTERHQQRAHQQRVRELVGGRQPARRYSSRRDRLASSASPPSASARSASGSMYASRPYSCSISNVSRERPWRRIL